MAEVSKRKRDSMDHRSQREIMNTITHSKEKSVQDDIHRDVDDVGSDDSAQTSRRGGAHERREETGARGAHEIDLERHREITNTGGMPGAGGPPTRSRIASAREEEEPSGPEKAGRKEGDDEWHNRSNRRGDRGNAEPGRGGNMAR